MTIASGKFRLKNSKQERAVLFPSFFSVFTGEYSQKAINISVIQSFQILRRYLLVGWQYQDTNLFNSVNLGCLEDNNKAFRQRSARAVWVGFNPINSEEEANYSVRTSEPIKRCYELGSLYPFRM